MAFKVTRRTPPVRWSRRAPGFAEGHAQPARSGGGGAVEGGLGVTLSDQARAWTTEPVEFGA